jgi:hypothetical protein
MRNRRRIESFVGHFHESLDRVAQLPSDDLHLKVLKKLGFLATIDALSKVGSSKVVGSRKRFVSFVEEFYAWEDGERVCLPYLVCALSRETRPEFQQLKDWADDSLHKWPSRGNPPSPVVDRPRSDA